MMRFAIALTALLTAMAGYVPGANTYEEDTHFQLTYVLMRLACFTHKEALQVASADWSQDTNGTTVAGLNSPNNTNWHALGTRAQIDKRKKELWDRACKSGDLVHLGQYFHFQEDTYAHLDEDGEPYGAGTGHAGDGHQPDRIPNNKGRAKNMAKEKAENAQKFLKDCLKREPAVIPAGLTDALIEAMAGVYKKDILGYWNKADTNKIAQALQDVLDKWFKEGKIKKEIKVPKMADLLPYRFDKNGDVTNNNQIENRLEGIEEHASVPSAGEQKLAVVETDWGLHKASFDTLNGKVVVYLPDDMAANDTISGTVVIEPAGRTEDERTRNQEILEGYVIVPEGKPQSKVGQDILRWALPAGLLTSIALRDSSGKNVGRADIPLQPTPPPPPPTVSIPPFGQAGRPIECPGPFNDDFADSAAKVNGAPLRPLAESPRKAVFNAPMEPGTGQCEVTEQGKTTSGPFTNLRVSLSAPKTTLLAGEKTTLECVVSGFGEPPKGSGLPRFELQVLTPSVVQAEEIPGDVISHSIRPEDVANGSYRYQTSLIGLRPGSFNVAARVYWLWPWSKKEEANPMLTKPPTPQESPFFKCCWLITVGPGKGIGDVDHSAVAIDGKVYSFEGNGMNVYPNVGAYLNKRKFEDGRQVWVNPVERVDKDAMRKRAQEVIDGGKPYHLTTNNCALNAGGLLEAGGRRNLLKEVKPLRLKNRNENLGEIGKAQEIKERQIE
jgi:hypothetical protein